MRNSSLEEITITRNSNPSQITVFILWLPFILFLYPGIAALFANSQFPVYFGKYSRGLLFLNIVNVSLYVIYHFSNLHKFTIGKIVSLLVLSFVTIIALANGTINSLKYIGIVWILIRFFCGISLLWVAFEAFRDNRRLFSSFGLVFSALLLIVGMLDFTLLAWFKIRDLKVVRKMVSVRRIERTESTDFRTANSGFELDREYQRLFSFNKNDIALVGDSMVVGSGVKIEDIMGLQLEGLLHDEGKQIKVHTLAMDGVDLGVYNGLLQLIPPDEKVERIIVGFYFNDMQITPYINQFYNFIHYSLNNASPTIKFARDLWMRSSKLTLEQYHQQMIDNFNKADITYESRWAYLREMLSTFYQYATERSEKSPVLMIQALTVDYAKYPLEEAHQDLTMLGKELGYEVLDLYPIFKEKILDGSQLRASPEDNHYGPEAHRLIAHNIADLFIE